jgi:dTDP-4-amino-4,6-dideoxygalactose transaminase
VEDLQEIAKRNRLRLLYDASHAMSVSHGGTMIGGFGDAEVFSFHATKFVNCFEGGAICTNNDRLAEKVRLIRNFGFSGLDNVVYLGTNGKMTEPSAAMGLTSLESIADFVAHNSQNFAHYGAGIDNIPGLSLIRFETSEKCNFQYVVVEVDQVEFGMTRDDVIQILHAENVRARRYFYPGVHRMEPYRSHYPNSRLWLPETERLAGKVMCLPTGTSVPTTQVAQITSLLQWISENATHIRDRIRST